MSHLLGEDVSAKGNFFDSLRVAFLFNAAVRLLKALAQFQHCTPL